MATFTISQPLENRSLYLIPSANGCNIDLTPVGEAINYECVNDPVETPNGDTNYVYTDAITTEYDLYELPDHTTETGVINYVQIFSRTKSHEIAQHKNGIHKIILTENACTNVYKSDDINLITGYTTYSNYWTENPRTLAAWTWDDIDRLQAGTESSSPSVSGEISEIIRPNGDARGYLHDQWYSIPTGAYYTRINEGTVDDNDYIYQQPGFLDDNLFNLTNPTTSGLDIARIVVFARVKDEYSNGKLKIRIMMGGNTYDGDEQSTTNAYQYISHAWTENPDTSAAWTEDNLDDLIAGVKPTFHSGQLFVSQLYIQVVYNLAPSSPEIRTTQVYVKINYNATKECTLNKPEEISVEDARNIKMLNFWSGNREVYDLSRNKKSIVLTGSEYQSDTCDVDCPCERITCMKDMGKRRETITITGLRTLFNGDYKIRSFGWKHISQKPEYYDWILELEYDD